MNIIVPGSCFIGENLCTRLGLYNKLLCRIKIISRNFLLVLRLVEKIYDYVGICDSVMSLDPKIRFVGVVSERGRLVAGGMKDSIKSLEDERDDEMIFMELALRVKMRKEFDEQLGPVKFAMALRERILAISVLINDDILYAVFEPDADYGLLPDKILDIVHS